MRQMRLASPVIWSAGAALAVLLLSGRPAGAVLVFRVACGAVIFLGICNDPTDPYHF